MTKNKEIDWESFDERIAIKMDSYISEETAVQQAMEELNISAQDIYGRRGRILNKQRTKRGD